MTPPPAPRPRPDTPLPPAAAALGVVAVLVMAVVAALVSVLLTPVRLGATLVPVAVVVAVLINIVLAALGFGLTRSKGIAGAPVALFLVACWTFSIGPGGDVLLPGGSTAQTAISYGTILAGLVAGVVTVARLH